MALTRGSLEPRRRISAGKRDDGSGTCPLRPPQSHYQPSVRDVLGTPCRQRPIGSQLGRSWSRKGPILTAPALLSSPEAAGATGTGPRQWGQLGSVAAGCYTPSCSSAVQEAAPGARPSQPPASPHGARPSLTAWAAPHGKKNQQQIFYFQLPAQSVPVVVASWTVATPAGVSLAGGTSIGNPWWGGSPG